MIYMKSSAGGSNCQFYDYPASILSQTISIIASQIFDL